MLYRIERNAARIILFQADASFISYSISRTLPQHGHSITGRDYVLYHTNYVYIIHFSVCALLYLIYDSHVLIQYQHKECSTFN